MSEVLPINSIEMLIEHYEMQMKRTATRSAVLAPMLSYVGVYSTITESFQEVLEEEGFKIEEEKETLDPNEDSKPELNTCETEEQYFSINKKEAKFLGVEKEYEVYFKNLDEEKANNFEDCWGCDLRPTFDWQIKPVNFLNELEQALSEIENSIDSFMEQISPRSFLKDFCPIFDLFDSDFRWLCGADLMALMNAIQMVLARYMNQAASFQVNWTTLLGPLIKFIAESLTASMENIRSILIAPLDCIKSMFITIDDMRKDFNEMTAMGETVYDGIARPFSDTKIGDKEFEKWQKQSSIDPKINIERREEEEIKKGLLGGLKRDSKTGIPTGYSFSLNSDLDSIFKEKKRRKDANQILPVENFLEDKKEGEEREKIDLLKMLILTINTAQKFINEFFANLIFSIKSLNQMIIGNISFNLKLGGTILFVIDLIQVVRTWIKLAEEEGIDSFSKLCEKFNESEENKEFRNEYFDKWINFGGPDDLDLVSVNDKNTCET